MASDQRTSTRTHLCYDPMADVTAAGWRIQLAELAGGATEFYDPVSRILYIDPEAYSEDAAHALAHAAAHLRYDLDSIGLAATMTPQQEACANACAALQLDRERV